ncbi:MAG: gephyrin-like molybdotransferase Glp [Methanosarcinales archaeon]
MIFKKLTNFKDAKKIFLNAIKPMESTEQVNIEDSMDRILAQDVIAPENVPHYRRATMDGYAVCAQDTIGASVHSPVTLQIIPRSETMTPHSAVRVHTGSPIPEGADAVVMIEDTEKIGNTIDIYDQVHPWKNVGDIGEDIKKDSKILYSGQRLHPHDIALLASLRIQKVQVYKKPVVAIIPTGEELVSRKTTKKLKPGYIIETNGLMTCLYIKKWGGIPIYHDIVSDVKEVIKEVIMKYLSHDTVYPKADMIILSGGTSVGKRDFVPEVVNSLGNILVHGINISPGKPTALGMIDNIPVVCLPGYPVAALVALFEFAKPALWKLGRFPNIPDRVVYGILGDKIASKTGYYTYARVKYNPTNKIVTPVRVTGAGILSSVSQSNGFVIIPEEVEGFNKGDEIEVVLID